MICTEDMNILQNEKQATSSFTWNSTWVAVFVRLGCWNNVPPTGCLKSTAIYRLSALKATSSKSMCQPVQPLGEHPSCLFLASWPSNPGLPWLAAAPLLWPPQLCRHSLCVCVPVSLFSKDTSHVGLWPNDLILTWIALQRAHFYRRPYSQVPPVGTSKYLFRGHDSFHNSGRKAWKRRWM